MMKFFARGIETLRQPDRNPRCYEMSDDERLAKIREWNARNVWNDPALSYKDQLAQELSKDTYYGA
jgi:hypothetical protein